MVQVIVLHDLDTPLTPAAWRDSAEKAAWCRDLHRVAWRHSLLSLDGLDAVCLFEATDAEAVRRIGLQLHRPVRGVWPVTCHASAENRETGPLARTVVVERHFEAPVEFAAVQAMEDRGAWCLDLHRVRFLHTYFSTDRCHMICVYAAPDAESVRIAQQKIGMPVSRIWPAEAIPGDPLPGAGE